MKKEIKMKHESYLSTAGIRYFNAIVEILKERGMDQSAYSIELSRLCSHYARYEEANQKAIDREKAGLPGFYNEFENGTVQVNAFFTIAKESSAAIDKLGAKFGLTPQDFEKIKKSVKTEEEADPSEKI